jgi:hypothetical protein
MNVYVRFAWGLFRGFQTLLAGSGGRTVEEPNFSDVTPTPKRQRADEGPTDNDDSFQESFHDTEPPLDLDTWTERDVEMPRP